MTPSILSPVQDEKKLTAYEKRKAERDRALALLLNEETRKAAGALAESLRAEGVADDEIVKRLASLFVKEPTLGDAIMKAFQNPGPAGFTISSGNHPKVGAGTWTPDLGRAADSDLRVQKMRAKKAADAEKLEKTRRDLRARRIDR